VFRAARSPDVDPPGIEQQGEEMHCVKCGRELMAGDKFCRSCGTTVGSQPVANTGTAAAHPTTGADVAPAYQASPAAKTRSKGPLVAIVVAVVLLAAVGGWFAWKKFGRTTPPPVQAAGPIVKVPAAIAFMGENYSGGEQAPPTAAEQVARAENVMAGNPGNARALNDAAVLFQSAGDNQRSGELLSQAHQLAPDDPVIDYNYARSLYQQGKTDDAIQQAENALKQQNDFDQARVLLADAAIQKKDYAAAEDHVSKLQKTIKDIEIAAFTIRGVILLEKGKTADALAMFQEALKLAGEDPTALYNMGVAEQRGDHLSDAQGFYERALAQDPNFGEAHNNLGTLLMALGKQQEAFDEFHAAAISTPGNQLFTSNLSETSREDPKDRIVGTWELEGGQYTLRGSVNGQPISQTIPLPPGSRITFVKVGAGSYSAQETMMGQQLSTTFQEQADGSYSAPAVIPEELKRMMPPGVSVTGTVVFWAHGERLFGDTYETATGQGNTMKGQKTWKAKRVTR
jgi:Tfp pilus assembly protein PilF